MLAYSPKSQTLQQTSTPLISVILPVYQGEALILRAVASVFQQSYRHLELIVVDDGSTDGTQAQLATVQDRRLRILSQPNQGVAVARNTGFSEAHGTYIAFLDADDLWFPEKLETELRILQQAGNPIAIAYSGYYGVDEHERLLTLSPLFRYKGNVYREALACEGLFLPSTSLIHRDIVETVGGFSSASYHEDRSFFIQACKHYPAFPTEQRLVVYRQALSGRCRGVLKNYEDALAAELSILAPLQNILTAEEQRKLTLLQIRNLLYRFLMYHYWASARRLCRQYPYAISPARLLGEKKGIVACLSLWTGINLLAGTRRLIQTFNRFCLLPWWVQKRSTVYSLFPRGHS